MRSVFHSTPLILFCSLVNAAGMIHYSPQNPSIGVTHGGGFSPPPDSIPLDHRRHAGQRQVVNAAREWGCDAQHFDQPDREQDAETADL
jgi:hypothetical protein